MSVEELIKYLAGLIERAQFALNAKIYEKGAFKDVLKDFEGSWVEWFLLETESFHGESSQPLQWISLSSKLIMNTTAKARRYTRYAHPV